MENASKALLMAAGVLIGMLIISLAVYLFTSFGTTSAEYHRQNAKQQMDQFNSQFTSYQRDQNDKEGITIYEVVTLANLATENNVYYEFQKKQQETTGESDYYISVKFNNLLIEKAYNSSSNIDYNQLIQSDLGKMADTDPTTGETKGTLPKYNCQVSISQTTRKSIPSNNYS